MEESPDPKWYRYRRTPGTTLAGLWVLAWLVSGLVLATFELNRPLQVAIAMVPLPFFGHFLWRFMRLMRQSDELERRIQLEALAIAFPMTAAALMTVGLLQTAEISPAGGWSLTGMWIYAGMFYLTGRAIARRRYR